MGKSAKKVTLFVFNKERKITKEDNLVYGLIIKKSISLIIKKKKFFIRMDGHTFSSKL